MFAAGRIRVLIVGCGIIGKHHGVVLTRHSDFEVTALVDVDPAAAQAAAEGIVAEGGPQPVTYPDISAALAGSNRCWLITDTSKPRSVAAAASCAKR